MVNKNYKYNEVRIADINQLITYMKNLWLQVQHITQSTRVYCKGVWLKTAKTRSVRQTRETEHLTGLDGGGLYVLIKRIGLPPSY